MWLQREGRTNDLLRTREPYADQQLAGRRTTAAQDLTRGFVMAADCGAVREQTVQAKQLRRFSKLRGHAACGLFSESPSALRYLDLAVGGSA